MLNSCLLNMRQVEATLLLRRTNAIKYSRFCVCVHVRAQFFYPEKYCTNRKQNPESEWQMLLWMWESISDSIMSYLLVICLLPK